ncbi:dynamin family protein [Verrucomicrobium sp. BvORR034]|uniref:dynamin family protein n=1 Tax=Verrucomicrobium sp. BvORR034 TaxID=1396418 RepID=UPI000678C67E|nr:dynamin family protein [Verrucomicrobium sp. BvORR034]
MIGEEYFDLRSRLGTALYSLKALVPELGAGPEEAGILENLVNSLKDPFVFVVVGEVNVGKSTFLNALFGTDLTKTGIVPTTDKIFFFKHGPQLRHVPVSRTLEEVYAPVEFLKDFHIVDTPGTNSIENEHQEITERFVPLADMVIFVFSAMNPWGASTWQFLDKVHRQWMRHVIFVLQQADLRTPEEIVSIQQYMLQLCRQRFGREFPVFPVSAKRAYLARSSGLDREKLMEESGYPKLEQHISDCIGGSGPRLGKLGNALRIAQTMVGKLAAQSTTRIAARERKQAGLATIEGELATRQERTLAKLSAAVDATELDFTWLAEELLKHLEVLFDQKLAFKCTFKERRSVVGVEKVLRDKLDVPSSQRWEQSASILEDDLNEAADHLARHMTEELRVQLHEDLRQSPAFWKKYKSTFAANTGSLVNRVIKAVGIEAELAPALANSRQMMIWMVLVGVVSAISAGIFAGLGHWGVGLGALAAGSLMAWLLWLACGRVFAATRKAATFKLNAARPELRHQLQLHTQEEVRDLYAALHRILAPTREKLSDQQKRQTFQHESLGKLEVNFKELDAKMAGLVARGV